jgi:hypothetical protein
MNILTRLFRRPRAVPLPDLPPPWVQPFATGPSGWTEIAGALGGRVGRRGNPFGGLPKPPPGVRPPNAPKPAGMAFDEAPGLGMGGAGAFMGWAQGGLWGEGLWFPGYPYLAELSQRAEYRNMIETVAEEMTRKWVTFRSTGDEKAKADRVRDVDVAVKRYGCRDVFRKAMELDGFMGMGLIYIDVDEARDDPDELKLPLTLTPEKIAKGSLHGFVTVDPTWVSPKDYNSINPLQPGYLRPSSWYVMGQEVHSSRLLIVRSRELPDLLKAGYNFGGLSLSQIAKPYVDNWLRTRQSVSDLLHSFTTFVLKTNMQAYLEDAGALMGRLSAFILGRDNRGLMMVDKDTEDLANVSAPLGSLDKLQAQAQEQMASVAQIPLVKLTGITPSGLNASSDGEIRVWYDRVHAKQEMHNEVIDTMSRVIQLSEFGQIDPEIEHVWVNLWELDEAGKAAVQKTKADTAAVLMADGVISNEEERERQANDPDSMFHGLKGPAPEPEPMEGEDPNDRDDAEGIAKAGANGGKTGANSGV